MTHAITAKKLAIIGGGAAGLMLAVQLAEAGFYDFVLLEKNPHRAMTSRATGFHRETIGMLSALGLAEALAAAGQEITGSVVYADRRAVMQIDFRNGAKLTEKNLSIEQTVVEQMLLDRLQQYGISPLLGCQLQRMEYSPAQGYRLYGVTNGASQIFKVQMVVGADGAHSFVRRNMGAAWVGELGEASFSLDITARHAGLAHDRMHQFIAPHQRVVLVPLKEPDLFKASGTLPMARAVAASMSQAELRATVLARIGVMIGAPVLAADQRDVALYHISMFLAAPLANQKAVLIGDAAHTFFPQGGFGLNVAMAEGACLAAIIRQPNFSDEVPQALAGFARESLERAVQVRESVIHRTAALAYEPLVAAMPVTIPEASMHQARVCSLHPA